MVKQTKFGNKTFSRGFSKPLTFFAVALLFTSMVTFAAFPTRADTPTYRVSGYVTDAGGNPLVGATVIFNSVNIHSPITNGSGYWATSAPAGTYRINVWPPFDTNYINYNEQGFQLSGDTTKNITLYTGCKVYGYITDTSGKPVVGAAVLFGNDTARYGSGYFSKTSGYYFLAIPAGTYTIDAHPRTDTTQGVTSFSQYYEYGFEVNGDVRKDIVVNMPAPTPTPDPETKYTISGYITDSSGKGLANAEVIFNVPYIVPSVFSDSTGFYQIVAPTGTYHMNVWPPFDSNYLSYDQKQLTVTGDMTKNVTLPTGYKVYGYIKDYSGSPVSKAIVILDGYLSGWFSKSDGYYALAVPAGTYLIDCHPGVGASGSALAHFPTYYEPNFNVTCDTRKDITVGTPPSSTPTPTSTSTNTDTTDATNQTTATPTPNPTAHATSNQAARATPHKTSAPRQVAVAQPEENTLEYAALLAVITVIAIVAVFVLVKVTRSRASLYPEYEEERRYR